MLAHFFLIQLSFSPTVWFQVRSGNYNNTTSAKVKLVNLLDSDVRWVEEQLRHREPLVVEPDGLFAFIRSASQLRAFEETPPKGREIRQHVIPSDFEKRPDVSFRCRRWFLDLDLGVFPGQAQVLVKVERNKAGIFLGSVHDVRLFQDVDLSVRDDLLQVVRQKFAADVDSGRG